MHPEPPQGSQGPWQQRSPTGASAPPVVPGGRLPAPGAVAVPVGPLGLLQGTPAAAAVFSGRHTYDY